ncbi:hybrid sensor histidine kinase/response regulator [bacterium]|nr:hybrid sensor histidine kinase/response regulator [bacterium]
MTRSCQVKDQEITGPAEKEADSAPVPSILFVDDDPALLQSLGTVLQSFGYEVLCIQEGDPIADIIQKREFDLVLTDLKMKEMDGLEVLRIVKLYQSRTPVVIITGYASLLSAIEAIHEGAYDYLIKPCNIKEMKMSIERGIQQKRIQIERDQYYQELQTKNAELQDAISTQVQLHQQLKESESFRETIVSMFTHDLFNPVTSINGFLHVLLNDPSQKDNQELRQYLKIIQRNVKKIELLANTFQAFYKIQAQQYELNHRLVDFCELVKETIRNAEVFGFDKNIQLHVKYMDNPVMIHGDPFELERVLTNILYNAIKFSPQNGVIECSLGVEQSGHTVNQPDLDPDTDYIVLSVKDYGIGIGQSDLDRLFEKFYRASNAHKYKGSGIGLYISKFVIDLHKGKITVKSSIGQGSEFRVYLPLAGHDQSDQS